MKHDKTKDIIKDFIFFILTTAIAFAYWMLVFLLISFLTLSYLHFTIEGIYVLATIGTVIVDIVYVWRKVRKYRKHG